MAGFVLVPFLALFLPFYQLIDFGNGGSLVDLVHVNGALEEGVHVKLAAFGSVAEEFKNSF